MGNCRIITSQPTTDDDDDDDDDDDADADDDDDNDDDDDHDHPVCLSGTGVNTLEDVLFFNAISSL